MTNRKNNVFVLRLVWFFVILGTVLVDQVSKYCAVRYLKPLDTLPLIQNVLHLTYSTNTGAAFGILKNQRWIFLVISTVAIILLSVYLWKKSDSHPLLCIALSFIIGGGIGNMIDRTVLGYVVDFIDFRLIHFAIFNGADSFVTVGCVMIVLWLLLFESEDTNPINKSDITVNDNADPS